MAADANISRVRIGIFVTIEPVPTASIRGKPNTIITTGPRPLTTRSSLKTDPDDEREGRHIANLFISKLRSPA